MSALQKMQNDHNLSLRASGLDRLWMVKRRADDYNFTPHVIGLAASALQKVQNDHKLSLRAIGLDRLSMAKRCANDHNLSLHGIGLAASE